MRVFSKRNFIFVFLFFGIMVFVQGHVFYVSQTDIKFIPEKQKIEIIVKLFSDNFEEALKKRGVRNLTLMDKKEDDKLCPFISKYINEKLEIEINGKKRKLDFIKKTFEEEATWSYFIIPKISSIQHFKIKNQLFLEILDAQTNIVRIKANGEKKVFNLNKKITSEEIYF